MTTIAKDLQTILAVKPRVKLKECGFQEGFGGNAGRTLYNVVDGDYAHGSTVTMESMKTRGFDVEVVK